MKRIIMGMIVIAVVMIGIATSNIAEARERVDESRINNLLNGRQYMGETYRAEQMYTEINQRGLIKKQPPVRLDFSLEREQLRNRVKLWNSRNKISYIYLFTMGRLVGFYAIKGKVSSVNSQLTCPTMVFDGDYQGEMTTIDSPSEDGSYGSNGDGIFFFLSDGTYMEWNGKYLLVDRPLKVTVEPMVVSPK